MKIDDLPVVEGSDLSRAVATLQGVVELKPGSEITVEVRGAPGSAIELVIDGIPKTETPPGLVTPVQNARITQNDPTTGCPTSAVYGYGFRIAFAWTPATGPKQPRVRNADGSFGPWSLTGTFGFTPMPPPQQVLDFRLLPPSHGGAATRVSLSGATDAVTSGAVVLTAIVDVPQSPGAIKPVGALSVISVRTECGGSSNASPAQIVTVVP